MRIGFSIPYLPSPPPDRGQAVSRGRIAPVDGNGDATSRGEITRLRSRAMGAEGVTQSDANLPQRARAALQSYLVNGPSLSERIGVELAGIDVLV